MNGIVTKKYKQPKKIIIFSHTANAQGGAESALLEMVEYLNDKGKIVPYFIVPREGSLTSILKTKNIKYTIIAFAPWYGTRNLSGEEIKARSVINFQAIDEMIKLIKRIQPDFTFTNTIVAPWLGVASAKLNKPHIWMLHEFGDIDHDFDFDYGYIDTLDTINRLSSAVIVNSKALAKHISNQIDLSKITQVYYAIADNILKPIKTIKPYERKNSFKCILLGRITPSKGQLDAVQAILLAYEQGVDAELLMIGSYESPDYLKEIQLFVNSHQLQDRITILEHQADPYSYIAASDVLLMCSQNEAFGRVTAEAMLLKKPVIGTNSGATKEIIQDHKTGLLYSKGNVNSLSDKIVYLAKNSDLAKKMGDRAHEFVINNFNHKNYEDRINLLFSSNLAPSLNLPLTDNLLDLIIETQTQLEQYTAELRFSIEHNQDLQAIVDRLGIELDEIISSKSWRIARRLSAGGNLIRILVRRRSLKDNKSNDKKNL